MLQLKLSMQTEESHTSTSSRSRMFWIYIYERGENLHLLELHERNIARRSEQPTWSNAGITSAGERPAIIKNKVEATKSRPPFLCGLSLPFPQTITSTIHCGPSDRNGPRLETGMRQLNSYTFEAATLDCCTYYVISIRDSRNTSGWITFNLFQYFCSKPNDFTLQYMSDW